MSWTNEEHRAALEAARAGRANPRQQQKLQEAAQQAGPRGREAEEALRKQGR